jgi:enamine deaminase RidA (YjgF/YER057c/UK114 family)
MTIILPTGWNRPRGYSNGIAARGRHIFVAGQIGWDQREHIVSDDLVDQAAQALQNIVAILEAAGAAPHHIVRMTWYVTDKREYLAAQSAIGNAYREIIGASYPAMTLVQVASLLNDRAKIEIEATAVVPDDAS